MSISQAPLRWTLDAGIMDMAIDVAGTLIAVGLGDGSLALLPRAGGAPVLVSALHRGAVQVVVHDPVHKRFVTGGDDGRLCAVSREGTTTLAVLGPRWIEHVLISPDTGTLIAAMGPDLFELHASMSDARLFAHLPSTPGALAFDPKRGALLAAHYSGVSRWRLDALEEPPELLPWGGAHLAVSVSPDGRWVVSGTQENALHVWPSDGSEDLGMRGYAAKPLSLAWSADSGLLLTSGLDNLAGWRFDGDGPRQRPPLMLGWGGGGLATQVAVHPSAPVAVTGFDNGSIIVSDFERQADYGVLALPDGTAITQIVWTPDGRGVVVAQNDGRVTLYEV